MVECLPSIQETLGSIPSKTKQSKCSVRYVQNAVGSQVNEFIHKSPHAVGLRLYGMPRTGKSIEIKSGSVVARGWEERMGTIASRNRNFFGVIKHDIIRVTQPL